MDLDFQHQLLKAWGYYDENIEWFLNFNEKEFWKSNARKMQFVSIFSQRISNPNDKVLDFLLTNRIFKKKITKVFLNFFDELLKNFTFYLVSVVDDKIVLDIAPNDILNILEKLILDSGSENINDLKTFYIQELDMLMDLPQDFTFCCIASKDFQHKKFQEIVYQNGLYLWE